MNGVQAADLVYKTEPVAIVFISGHYDKKLIECARLTHVLGYLVKPIKAGDMETAIAVAMARFDELKTLRAEVATMKQAPEDRKIVERAKGIIMKSGVDETEAFKRLQSCLGI